MEERVAHAAGIRVLVNRAVYDDGKRFIDTLGRRPFKVDCRLLDAQRVKRAFDNLSSRNLVS